MRLALAEAMAAAGEGEVPVGAVILGPSGEVVARGHNRREADGDPTAHAEMVAIRAAAGRAGTWRLDDYTLVVTLEPCTMCAGAISAARISRLVYAAADPRAGAVGSLWDVIRDPRVAPWPEVMGPEVIGGALGEECLNVIRTFFSERRQPGQRY